MNVISLRGIHHGFGNLSLFEGLDLDVESGKIHGLMGPNGAGKSVLLRIVCRLIAPRRGTVDIASRFLPSPRVYPDRFGVTIDGPAYLPGYSAEQNLMQLASIRGRAGRNEIRSALEAVGLSGMGNRRVSKFSMGMKQKLALAQAIMEEQEVLILDEPFNALDAPSVELIRALLLRKRDAGATILFTSHDRSTVEDLADVVSVIEDRVIRKV